MIVSKRLCSPVYYVFLLMQKYKVSKTNAFLLFTEKFKIATKNAGKIIFLEKNCQMTLQMPWSKKFHRNCSILHRFRDKSFFLCFKQKFKMASKNSGKTNFWRKSTRAKTFAEIALYRTISKINAFLRFMQKIKRPPKMVGKQFLRKSSDYSVDTLGSKISSKSLYLALFPR